jgi:hypothetical protein
MSLTRTTRGLSPRIRLFSGKPLLSLSFDGIVSEPRVKGQEYGQRRALKAVFPRGPDTVRRRFPDMGG